MRGRGLKPLPTIRGGPVLERCGPSGRLVVGRRGSTGLIGVIVPHRGGSVAVRGSRYPRSVRALRIQLRRCRVRSGRSTGLSGVVARGVDRLWFAAAAIPGRFGRWGFSCVVVVVPGFGFVVGWAQESFGAVVVVDAGLAGVQVWGGVHSTSPRALMVVVQPPSWPTMRLSGPQARPSSSTLVWPPSTQSLAAWWTWAP